MIAHLDWESRSNLDLTKCGLYTYSKGAHTDLWMGAWAIDDGEAKLWLPGEPCPPELKAHIESGGQVWAHSAEFEIEMCNQIAAKRYGWPTIKYEQTVCTKAMAFALGLPGTLEKSAAALGVSQQKDMEGKRLMLMMCAPRGFDGLNARYTWWDEPEKIKRLGEYCLQDLEVEREIGKRMLQLSTYEKKVWQLDQKINSRGIKIDMPAVESALKLVDQEKQKLIKEIQDVSGNEIASPHCTQQIKDFLFDHLVPAESIAKAEAGILLARTDLPDVCRRVLDIRRDAAKTSTAKLAAMLDGSSPDDRRFRGGFQYSGANTRRWAGRRIQLQNFPRTKFSPEEVESIFGELSRPSAGDRLRLFYGPPLNVISNCLRGFLIADEGKEFLCCDFASIEARVIAWLAGQESVLEIFRTHGKVYEHAASSIFGKHIDDIDSTQRQIGKVAILALGYQGGVGALQKMAKAYGATLSGAYTSLWSRATPDQKDWVEERWRTAGKEYEELSREEFIASDLTKVFWRLANPKIVEFWGQLEANAANAVNYPGQKFRVPFSGIVFKKSGSFLFCRLPSGGVLSYPYPQVSETKDKWGRVKPTLSYMAEDQNYKWTRFTTYGGSIAENVTQSFARDLLADAMLRLESRGYEIVAHVHDEVIVESPIGTRGVEAMANIMSEVPEWAKGLPIAATGYTAKRYRKS